MRLLEQAGCYDVMDVTNLASFEILMRRLQLIEYTYSEKGPAPPSKEDKGKGKGKSMHVGLYDESQIFMGSHKEFGDIMVAPDLLEYVSKEVEKEAAVMKQVRKAREERAALSKKKDEGGGG